MSGEPIVCPVHTPIPDPITDVDKECLVVLNDSLEDGRLVPPANTFTFSQRHKAMNSTACRFVAVTDPLLNKWTCTLTDYGDPMAVSLADYGKIVPIGAPTGAAWLLGLGRAKPANNFNTALIFDDDAHGPKPFTGGRYDVELFETAFNGGGSTESDWGGTSCDYYEFNRRFVCIALKGGVKW